MKISVVIPTYNSEQFIADALDSVNAQSRAVDEIICVDDASTDKTIEIIRDKFKNVTLLRNKENQGPSASRNKAIAIAQGNIISFLDADDCWTKNKTLHQSMFLESEPELEIVGGLTDFYSAEGNEPQPEGTLPGQPHFNTYLSSLLIRKKVFNSIGMFDTTMRLSEDQDWFLRAREGNTRIKITDDIVLMKRIHSTNLTRGLNFRDSAMITAIKNSLDRRRKSGALHNLKPFK